MVNAATVAKSLAKLAMLKYFPADKEARTAIVEMVCEMISDESQAEWLVKRVLTLYNEWPGPHELRATFCSKFPPRDGINAYSQVYIDGIPSERQSRNLIAGPQLKALPPGHAHSANEDMERVVIDLAAAMPVMPQAIPGNDRFARTIRELETAPKDRPELPKTPQIITEEDCQRAVEENHRRMEEKTA